MTTDFKELSLHGTCNIFAYEAGLILDNLNVLLVNHTNANYEYNDEPFVQDHIIIHAFAQLPHGQLFDASGLLNINVNQDNWEDLIEDYIDKNYYDWYEPHDYELDPIEIIKMPASKLKEITLTNPSQYWLNTPQIFEINEYQTYQDWVMQQVQKLRILP